MTARALHASAQLQAEGLVDRSLMRRDIQALRGLAILLVLIYHSQLLPALKAGYLGVDIFFVVSGYLITGIVVRALQSGRFSFAEFYGRRAKRLLPATYVSLLCTAVAAPLFLPRAESTDFLWQLTGALTFTGNIVLWMQTGYFEGAAQLKPLPEAERVVYQAACLKLCRWRKVAKLISNSH